ncbi:hypothetical protein ASF60_21840 [Methylobacterium sp. Leaf113]|nr:hypothetical protein ASF60_21840 [Methylobacterium sp. Leaf113]
MDREARTRAREGDGAAEGGSVQSSARHRAAARPAPAPRQARDRAARQHRTARGSNRTRPFAHQTRGSIDSQ